MLYWGKRRKAEVPMGRERSEFEQKLDEETEARIARMEQEDYAFPRRFSRRDYLLWALVTAACLVLVVLGGQL